MSNCITNITILHSKAIANVVILFWGTFCIYFLLRSTQITKTKTDRASPNQPSSIVEIWG